MFIFSYFIYFHILHIFIFCICVGSLTVGCLNLLKVIISSHLVNFCFVGFPWVGFPWAPVLRPKVKYDIGAEILLSTCTLHVNAVLGSYSKIRPATGILSTRSIDLDRSQGCRSNFENQKNQDLHPRNL